MIKHNITTIKKGVKAEDLSNLVKGFFYNQCLRDYSHFPNNPLDQMLKDCGFNSVSEYNAQLPSTDYNHMFVETLKDPEVIGNGFIFVDEAIHGYLKFHCNSVSKVSIACEGCNNWAHRLEWEHTGFTQNAENVGSLLFYNNGQCEDSALLQLFMKALRRAYTPVDMNGTT